MAVVTVAGGSTAWAKPKIAILGIETIGAMDAQQTELAKELTNAFRARAGSGVFSLASNSRKELVDEKLMGNCSTEALGCMSIISNNLGAEYLMYGHLEKTTQKGTDGYQINLWLLKVSTKPTLSGALQDTYNQFHAAKELNGGAMTKLVDAIYIKMTGEKVEKANGRLVIRVANAQSGTVYIDGDEKGALSNGRFAVSLPEGSYRLAIEAEGFKRYEEVGLKLSSGGTREVPVDLVKLDEVVVPPPPPPRKSRTKLYVGIVGGVMLATAATAAVLWTRNYFGPISDYQDLLDKKEGAQLASYTDDEELDSEDCDRTPDYNKPRDGAGTPPETRARMFRAACRAADAVKIDIGVTVGAGLVGIGMLAYVLFTDPAEHNGSSVSARKQTRRIALEPILTPTSSGALLRINW